MINMRVWMYLNYITIISHAIIDVDDRIKVFELELRLAEGCSFLFLLRSLAILNDVHGFLSLLFLIDVLVRAPDLVGLLDLSMVQSSANQFQIAHRYIIYTLATITYIGVVISI